MSSAGSYGSGGGGGGVGNVKFLTGDSGGPVGPDLVGNINIVGGVDVVVSGNASDNTLTINLTGSIANTYVSDSGSATPALGILNVNGASGIHTTASGNTLVIETNGEIATTYNCDNSTSAVPSGGILNVTGGTSGAVFTGSGNTITESFNYLSMEDTTSSTGAIVIGGTVVLNAGGGVANANIFVGESAGNFTVTGTFNSALGAGASTSLTTGSNNVAIGKNTLTQATTDSGNTGVGASSLLALRGSSSGNNTACGFASLFNLHTGNQNIALGYDSGVNYIGAESSNIVIGSQGTLGESNAIRIGTQGSGLGEQDYCNIAGIYGSTVGGTNSVVFIDNTGKLGTSGGAGTGVTTITGDSVGTITGAVTLTGGTSGAFYTTSGGNTLTTTFTKLNMPFTNVGGTQGIIQFGGAPILGFWGGVGENNVFLGDSAGDAAMTGTKSTGVGSECLGSVTSGTDNTGLGFATLGLLSSGSNNTAVGQEALDGLLTGSANTVLGNGAGSSYTSSESSNILIGNAGTVGESNQIRIGTQGVSSGEQNLCNIAGIYGSTVGVTNAAVFIDNAGNLGTVGGSGGGGVSSLTGSGGGGALTGALTLAGGASGAVYTGSGSTITTTFTKINMPYTNVAGTQGVIQFGGTDVMGFYGGSGNNNTYLGDTSGNVSVSTTGNTGIGANTQFSNTGGTDNTSMGNFSLSVLTAGNFNTALGALALQHLGTGGSNACVGFQAGSAYTAAESGNICIGSGVTGTAAESNAIHIGDSGSSTTCFIGGIAGVTVASSAAVLINTGTNQLGTVVSSRRFKENISDMGAASGDIYKLRPVKFNYKGDYAESYGLIAEDVEEVMPYLVSYDKEGLPATVRYHELPALLLNEIQRLKLKIDELEGKFNARVRP